MARRRTTTASLARAGLALALTAAAGGCKQSDSILLIEVAGPNDLNAVQLTVTVSAGQTNDGRNFLVPPTPRAAGDPIVLPASFTLALDRSHTAPITVSIDALDAQGSAVGFGTTMQQHIEIGGQTTIAVMLMPGLPPDGIDAGADGPADAGSAGGTGGAGSGGADGAAGEGGAAGQGDDGSADRADAMGLDGAAD